MPRLYEKLCKGFNQRYGRTREELSEAREKKRMAYQKKKKELRKSEDELNEIKVIKGEHSREYRKAKKVYDKVEKECEFAKIGYLHEDFNKTIYFVNMDLEYEDVFMFSIFLAILSGLATGLLIITIQIVIGLTFTDILMFVIPSIVLVPLSVLLLVSSYPDILEKKLKAESIGRAPESINYMTMSMRVRPSLYRAVSFSAKHTEEPMSSGLNKVLWEVYTRKRSSLEESFLAFALQWGEWNEDLKRSLYAVRSAMLEKTKHGMNAALEKANDIIISGTKRQVEDFSNSLSTPTTILFAMGVLLPLIIGAMLPMLALGDLNISGLSAEESMDNGGLSLFTVVIFMNVITPLAAFIYSFKILCDRPGTTSPPDIPMIENRKSAVYTAIILLVGISLPLVLFRESMVGIMPLPYFWPPVVAITYYCIVRSQHVKRERRVISEMEREFPDALFQLGSRIAEGMAVETAFLKTARSMEGTKIGELLSRITTELQIDRSPLEETLFGKEGVLTKIRSRTIKATMRTVVEVTKKDPADAGKTIIQISSFLRDMEEMEHDIRSKLSQSVEMMKGTAMIFAPVVMGVVVSLYFMLHGIFIDISQSELITPGAFTAVVGIYLVMMCFVITYFTTGIKTRVDPVEFQHELGVVLPVCICIFSVTVIVGRIVLVA